MDNDKTTTPSPSDEQTGVATVTQEEQDTPGKKSAEARINELLSKNKQLEEKMNQLEVKVQQPLPPPPIRAVDPEMTPEVQKAIDFLKEKGKFVDADTLAARDKALQDRMSLDGEHNRLEGQFSGADGRPKYDRREVENYMRQQGIWNPSAAYDQMHRTELIDFEIKQAEASRKKKPYIPRPGSTEGERENEQTITRDMIQEWIQTPEGRLKYEQNRDKILKLMAKGLL